MHLLRSKGKNRQERETAPPAWTPAVEERHDMALYSEATYDEYEAAEAFCAQYPVERPRLLPSEIVGSIAAEGCRTWSIRVPMLDAFRGRVVEPRVNKREGEADVVKVTTERDCKSVCLMSDLPVMAGLYDSLGKQGVYYEVQINKMNGIVAIGTACAPYPGWRFPGWNRSSAGLHLDDLRKFFECPFGGQDYDSFGLLNRISPRDTIGCGYEFASTSLFFTYNGRRLSSAFSGIYLPRREFDVYAAIGVEGENDIEVNFGGDVFRWKEGNDWAWKVEGQVGSFTANSRETDELPKYSDIM